MSGDGDWGIVNLAPKPDWLAVFPDWVWSYDFPNNVINAGVYIEGCTGRFCSVLPEPVWPTSLYETIMCLLLFSLLWLLRKKISIPGMIFSIYLILNGTERFFIEKIRVNTEYNFLGGITQAEIISFCLIITGILLSFFFVKKYKKEKINSVVSIHTQSSDSLDSSSVSASPASSEAISASCAFFSASSCFFASLAAFSAAFFSRFAWNFSP